MLEKLVVKYVPTYTKGTLKKKKKKTMKDLSNDAYVMFLAHLSQRLKVSFCDRSSSVVRRLSSVVCLSTIYSKISIIRSARDCRISFELSLVRISKIGSLRTCSDFLFNVVEVMGKSALKVMSCLKVELIIFYA